MNTVNNIEQGGNKVDFYPLDFEYLYGIPISTGVFKGSYEDFNVVEDLGFELSGDGEHVCLWVNKVGENTQYIAKQLAKFANIPAKNVSYAGLKDRQGDTTQWFSLHIPGKNTPDFSFVDLSGVSILKIIRHHKKIKIGALSGNFFSIVLRDISDKKAVKESLKRVSKGVPNYFGLQRFGHAGHNISSALKMFAGRSIKDRFKRGMYLSAARSYLFNYVVSKRIKDNTFMSPIVGDCVQFVTNRSFFPLLDLNDVNLHRLHSRKTCLTAPLWGAGNLSSVLDAQQYEIKILSDFPALQAGLATNKLKQARRPLMLVPTDLSSQWLDEKTVKINFYLSAGSYATSILREIIK
ncbi:MAG: tRNA pseudouridine(13) synthase TruD [Psychromonas sp.]|nr:tRNA pseudouridine(13) synthase TruD [Psychromonas sp.]